MTEQEKSLKELMQELINKQDEQIKAKKEKAFKIPFFSRLTKRNLKKNYILVQYINDNKEISFIKVPISEQTLMIKDTPYLAMAKYMMTYKGKPFMIIPSWNVDPFCPQENLDDAEKAKTMSVGYRLLMNRMKSAVIEGVKKKMSWLIVIIGLAAAAALIFLLTKGQNLKII